MMGTVSAGPVVGAGRRVGTATAGGAGGPHHRYFPAGRRAARLLQRLGLASPPHARLPLRAPAPFLIRCQSHVS